MVQENTTNKKTTKPFFHAQHNLTALHLNDFNYYTVTY